MVSPLDQIFSEAAPMAGVVAQQQPLKAMAAKSGRRPAAKSKKDQLLALIAKPAGTKLSVLAERLGWKAHTVRAALSGLRKQGHQILATKAPKTGESVYRLMPAPHVNADTPRLVASET